MRTYKVLSLLLGYPSQSLQDNMLELKEALVIEGVIKGRNEKKLYAFMDRLAQLDLLKLQEQYVALFDRSRTCIFLSMFMVKAVTVAARWST